MNDETRKTDRIKAVYELDCSMSQAGNVAKDICYEQTVEVDEALVTDEFINDEIVGKIECLESLTDGRHRVTISYNQDITCFNMSGLFNVLFGNISLKQGILLTSVEFPESFTSHFKGPRFGLAGIRDLLGVRNRPLLSAPLKPMGKSPSTLASLCYELACGGIDIIKDDHGLSDQCFCSFEERVKECVEAIKKAYAATGKRTLYFPCILGEYENTEKRIRWAGKNGADGVLLPPVIFGFDFLRYISSNDEIGMPVMAHPSLSGGFFSDRKHGIRKDVMLGTLMRLSGADMVVYPNFSGRFPFSMEDCVLINDSLKKPFNNIKPSFPVPAGGTNLENIPLLKKTYGKDVVFLVGSSLFLRSHDIRDNVRYFLSLVED